MKTKAVPVVQTREEAMRILKAAALGLMSFLFGSAHILGAVSPFSVALCCSVPIRYSLTTALGGILGSFLFSGTQRPMYYTTAILIVTAARLICTKLIKRPVRAPLSSTIGLLAMAVSAISYTFMKQMPSSDIALLFVEVMLTGCLGYFFAVGLNLIFSKERLTSLSYAENASICILFITTVTALTSFQIANLNFGVIFGVLSIYVCLVKKGMAGGCFAAIAVSIALDLYSMEMIQCAGMLIIASFIGGAFTPLGKFGQIVSFIASCVGALLLMGVPVLITFRIIDVFIATAIFVLIPSKYLKRDEEEKKSSRYLIDSSQLQSEISTRLSFASDTIRDLQDELESVSSHFSEIDYHNIGTIYDAAADRVCRGCSRKLLCWDEEYNDTINAFNPVSDVLRSCGEIDIDTLPSYFRDKCCKTEQLCRSVNEYYKGFVSHQNAKRQMAESRRIVFEQFDSIADMLTEVSDEFSEVASCDLSMTKAVSNAWNKVEQKPDQIICSTDRFGRSRAEIYTSNIVKTSPKVLQDTLSNASLKEFDLPSISHVQNRTKLSFFEKASYAVDFSVQQSCVGDHTVCGDSYEFFPDSRGYVYLLLSDGMGNGKRAAIDSVMTCSILLKLIKAGFGLESAVKLINSSLLVKSTDESLATIDLTKLDLYTGNVEFFKAGAATTFLWRQGEIERIESGSLPVGILQGVILDKQSSLLGEDDIVVMVSDGVTSLGEGFIADEIRRNSHRTAHDIAVKLCSEAKERTKDIHPDDITVMVAKITCGV